MAVLVSIALVVWLVMVAGDPAGKPTTPVSSSADPSVDPTDVNHSEPGGIDWGDFPPNNVDSLNDLSDPVFPKTVGAYSFVKENRNTSSVVADFEDVATFDVVSATINFDTASYAVAVENLPDPAYVGRAVCGEKIREGGRIITCVMAGENETLFVGTGNEENTVEELAAFTEELYDAL